MAASGTAAARKRGAGDSIRLEAAAVFVSDALAGRSRPAAYKGDSRSLRVYKCHHSAAYRSFLTLVAVAHMALVLVESPSGWRQLPVAPGSPPRTFMSTTAIEGAILLAYCLDIAIQVRYAGVSTYLSSRWNSLEAIITLLFCADVITTATGLVHVQFSRAFRPLFVVTKRRHVRFLVTGVLHAVPALTPLLLIALALLAIFSFVGVLLLSSSSGLIEGLATQPLPFPPLCSPFVPPREPPPGNLSWAGPETPLGPWNSTDAASLLASAASAASAAAAAAPALGSRPGTPAVSCEDYFSSVPVAAYTAFGLFGKTSWPNAMVPFIQRNPASSILFLLFMLAGDFFLVRVIVAVAFASFSDSANARLLRQAELSRIAVRRAFRLLADADTGFVSLEAFRALAIKVRPSVPAEVYDVVFRAVGGDCGLLGPTAFVAACRLLDVNARPVPGAVRTARAIARLLEEAPPKPPAEGEAGPGDGSATGSAGSGGAGINDDTRVDGLLGRHRQRGRSSSDDDAVLRGLDASSALLTGEDEDEDEDEGGAGCGGCEGAAGSCCPKDRPRGPADGTAQGGYARLGSGRLRPQAAAGLGCCCGAGGGAAGAPRALPGRSSAWGRVSRAGSATSLAAAPPPRAGCFGRLRDANDKARRPARRWLRSPVGEVLMVTVSIVAAVVEVIHQATTPISGKQAGDSIFGLEATSTAFGFFFLAEMLTKMWAYGLWSYGRRGLDVLDGVVAVAGGAALLARAIDAEAPCEASQLPNPPPDAAVDCARVLLVLALVQALRVLRVLRALRPFWRPVQALRRTAPLLVRIAATLFIVLYSIAAIAMELFAGSLSPYGPRASAVLESGYGRAGFWPLNFGTFPGALLMSFWLALNAKAPFMYEGVMASENSWHPLAFFVVAYVALVLAFLPVVQAFVIRGFQAHLAMIRRRDEGLVEGWEHLCAAAQARMFAERPQVYGAPQRWVLSLPERFGRVGEVMFGATLRVEFEGHASLRPVSEAVDAV